MKRAAKWTTKAPSDKLYQDMRVLRRRLRMIAATWVVLQTVSLSALAAPWCCLGSQAPAMSTNVPPCHMHQEQAGAHQHSAAPEQSRRDVNCSMRAACGGQAAALFASLSHIAVLQGSIVVADSRSADVVLSSHDQLTLQFPSPDAPPPRTVAFAKASAALS